MTADYVFTDGQNGVYSADPQGRPFQLEADVSRIVFGGSDGTIAVQPTSDISYTPTTSEFAPKFNQLFMRSDDGSFYPVNQSNDGRFYPANTGQVQIPTYDVNPGLPCITQPCSPYDALATTNLQQSQLRPDDIVRIIMAANGGGNYMERGYMPSRWNNPQFSMYQPGRVPPSQVQAYNVARILLDPNSCMDDRGMYPSDYPQLPCQRSNRCNPQAQWMNSPQRFNSNPHSYHQMVSQMQRFGPNQGFNPNLAVRLGPNFGVQFNPNFNRNFNPNYAQNFNPNYPQNFNPNFPQNFNPNYPQNFNPNYPQNFNPNYNPNFNPNYAQNFNPNFNPNYNPDYNPNYPMDYDPNYPQDYSPSCNPRYNPRFDQQWNNPGCSGNGNMSQLMRYAPFVLSMLSRGGRGFQGGFPGGFPGGFGGGYNQFNRFGGGYNNFNNFNRFGGGGYGGGRGVGIRLGNFSFRL